MYLKNKNEENELKKIVNNSLKDYAINGNFKVHDKNWQTADLGLNRLKNGASFSDSTSKIINYINNDLTNENNLLNPDNESKKENRDYYENYFYSSKITGVAKLQGGVDLYAISSLFGNHYLYKKYDEQILRCNGEFDCFRYYSCSECDLQSIIVFNEFLKKYDKQTTLEIIERGKIANFDTNRVSNFIK